jgi:polysaccharide export outer membrane protein
MINLYKFIALLVLCLCTTAALAQNTSTVELLLGQPGLSEQLGELTPQVNAAQAPSSVPTAETAQTANADDVQQDTDVLVQSLGEQDSPPSVIQQYFKILTGRSLEIYGAQEFSQKQDEQLLFFNTVGKNYRLAPGDVVRVTLRGLNQSNESYKIGNDGSLTLPNLPPVAVSGMTIAEVEKSLLDVIQYDDASALVFISLETARLITVQVSGAVNQPRTLAIPAYTPLSRVLAYVGGVNATGSLRNIVLSDRNGSGVEIDFYDFLQSPLGSNDPLVTDSSRIFVPNQGATVATSGFVARPGIYELPFGQDENQQ